MSYRRKFWWHPRGGEVGQAKDNPYPPDECVLSDYRWVLEQMRVRFEQMCRGGWYGPNGETSPADESCGFR